MPTIHGKEYHVSTKEIPKNKSIPTEFILFTWGRTATTKGKFLLDKEAANSVMKHYKKKGIDLFVDYEHKSLEEEAKAKDGKAAAWFTPEVRDDGLWATNVQWTEPAKVLLNNREYRYYSPSFMSDDNDRITELVNVALTNLPATHGIKPLILSQETKLNALSSTWKSKKVGNPEPDEVSGTFGDALLRRRIAKDRIKRRKIRTTGSTKITFNPFDKTSIRGKDINISLVKIPRAMNPYSKHIQNYRLPKSIFKLSERFTDDLRINNLSSMIDSVTNTALNHTFDYTAHEDLMQSYAGGYNYSLDTTSTGAQLVQLSSKKKKRLIKCEVNQPNNPSYRNLFHPFLEEKPESSINPTPYLKG